MNLQLLIFAMLFSNFVNAQEMISLPSKDERGNLFQAVVDEINRLDGEGLSIRGHRPESWEVTTAKLKEEAQAAKNLFELGRVFKRLNATYPNLHSNGYMYRQLDRNRVEGRLQFYCKIAPNLIQRDRKTYDYYILPT